MIASAPPLANSPSATRARVAVMATGGTIAACAQQRATTLSYVDSQVSVEDMLDSVSGAIGGIDVLPLQIFQMGSENFDGATWATLAMRIDALTAAPDVSGIVVTQGTDTLEETAYFLHLVLKTEVPVVLVGAMRPSTAISADGPLNLLRAIQLAASPVARGKGVLVLLNDRIFSARDVSKTHTCGLDSFQSSDFGALGYMQEDRPCFYRLPLRAHTLDTPFNITASQSSLPRVEITYGYAGGGREAVDAFVCAGAAGIVHAGTGNGTMSQVMQEALLEATLREVIVVRSSRTGSGIVTPQLGLDTNDRFIPADSLNPQKARVLLQLALTQTRSTSRIRGYFERY